MVEDLADHDGIVRWIVMPKAVSSMHAAPGHLRPGKKAVEESSVQVLENCLEIVGMPLRARDSFPATHLPNQVRLPGDVMAAHVPPVTRRMFAFNWLAVNLGDQDVEDCVKDAFGGAFQ